MLNPLIEEGISHSSNYELVEDDKFHVPKNYKISPQKGLKTFWEKVGNAGDSIFSFPKM